MLPSSQMIILYIYFFFRGVGGGGEVIIEEFIYWTVPMQESELLLLIPKQSNPFHRVSISPCGHAIIMVTFASTLKMWKATTLANHAIS